MSRSRQLIDLVASTRATNGLLLQRRFSNGKLKRTVTMTHVQEKPGECKYIVKQTSDSDMSFFENLKRRWNGRSVDKNFTFDSWNFHQQNTRHWRQIYTLPNSMTFRRLMFPDVFLIGCTASFITWWNVNCINVDAAYEVLETEVYGKTILLQETMITLPALPFTLVSTALGLLVTFRTQSSYNRFVQARKDWGQVINLSRDLTSRILARLPGQDRIFATKLAQTFCHTLRYHLTENGCNEYFFSNADMQKTAAEREQKKADKLREELFEKIWVDPSPRDVAFLDRMLLPSVINRPLYTLHEINKINADAYDVQPEAQAASNIVSTAIDERVTDLQHALGSCERILRTPIYTPYTHHTSRFLMAWCNMLPMALYPIVGPFMTIPFAVGISYMMLGIEDIGSRIEEPFSVLPLHQYCDAIDASCGQLHMQNRDLEAAAPAQE